MCRIYLSLFVAFFSRLIVILSKDSIFMYSIVPNQWMKTMIYGNLQRNG